MKILNRKYEILYKKKNSIKRQKLLHEEIYSVLNRVTLKGIMKQI